MNLEDGTQLGEYRILSRIGQGSYGVVFEAEHAITRRVDAVKLMHDAGSSSSEDEQRFLREIQAQASLQHPNIATVYGAFRTPWGVALAMELIKGQSLRKVLEAGPLPTEVAIGYILAVLDGLSCAERLGIIHRDIKPDNILITETGTVKITDFGLAQVADSARITSSGENLGTPCYMSPEQAICSSPADARSDVYSTAVVLYEAVTGRPPFIGTNGFAVMMAHQSTLPVAPIELQPSIGGELNRVILKALEKVPDRRFQNAAEFHAALERAAVVAEARGTPRPAGRIWKLAAASGAAGVTLGLCGLGAWAGHWAMHRAAPAPVVRVAKPVPPPQGPAPIVPVAAPAVLPANPPEPATEAEKPAVPVPHRPVRRTAKRTKPTFHPASVPRLEVSRTIPPDPGRPAAASATPAPALPPPPAADPLPAGAAAPVAQNVPEPVQPKRKNIFRRAIGRIFGHRETPPAQAAAPKSDSIKP